MANVGLVLDNESLAALYDILPTESDGVPEPLARARQAIGMARLTAQGGEQWERLRASLDLARRALTRLLPGNDRVQFQIDGVFFDLPAPSVAQLTVWFQWNHMRASALADPAGFAVVDRLSAVERENERLRDELKALAASHPPDLSVFMKRLEDEVKSVNDYLDEQKAPATPLLERIKALIESKPKVADQTYNPVVVQPNRKYALFHFGKCAFTHTNLTADMVERVLGETAPQWIKFAEDDRPYGWNWRLRTYARSRGDAEARETHQACGGEASDLHL